MGARVVKSGGAPRSAAGPGLGLALATAVAVLSPGCTTAPGAAPAVAGAGGNGELRLEISLSRRELYEFRRGALVNTFSIAVGRPGHETPTGRFAIHQVDWNPDWTPPDSPWAEGREYKPPGHPGNPMGRVRMIYRAPYSIHGTEDLASLGRAASHGSVRMANREIMDLARRVMDAGGAARSGAWFREVIDNPTEMRRVALPDPVPLIIEP